MRREVFRACGGKYSCEAIRMWFYFFYIILSGGGQGLPFYNFTDLYAVSQLTENFTLTTVI